MAKPLRFHPLVANDLSDANRWYDEISAELGNRFRMRIDAQLDEITQRPESFPVAFGDVRFARIGPPRSDLHHVASPADFSREQGSMRRAE